MATKKTKAAPAWVYKKGKAKKYKTVGGKKYVWRKSYKTGTGRKAKTVKGRWIPLAGAAKKAAAKASRKKTTSRRPARKTSRRKNPKTKKKSTAKTPAWRFKKGKATAKTVGGKKYKWRKGYTSSTGKRVRGMWVLAPKGTSRRKPAKSSRRRNVGKAVSRVKRRVRRRR